MKLTLDLSAVPDLPVPQEVLRELLDRAQQQEQEIQILVIGAAARDLVVHAPTERSRRATLDLDVAIAVDRSQFQTFTRGLTRVRNSEHKFLMLGVEVDVVPFGPIETNRAVELNDGHRLDVNGLAEAATTAVRVLLRDGLVVDVASLPAQAVLKVLAWRDRHDKNPKDGADLQEILEAAGHGRHADETWNCEPALEWANYDIYLASAFRVGRVAAEPFTEQDGCAVLDVLRDPVLAERLARHMGGLESGHLLDAFGEGFSSGLCSTTANGQAPGP